MAVDNPNFKNRTIKNNINKRKKVFEKIDDIIYHVNISIKEIELDRAYGDISKEVAERDLKREYDYIDGLIEQKKSYFSDPISYKKCHRCGGKIPVKSAYCEHCEYKL